MSKEILRSVAYLLFAMALIAGAAVAEETEKTEATPDVPQVETEGEAAPEKGADDTPLISVEPIVEAAATSGITCTCDCVCPASGASEQQTFKAPLWIASCSQFNGDRCTVTHDTCNTPRQYQNCTL